MKPDRSKLVKMETFFLVALWQCQSQNYCESMLNLLGELSVAVDRIFCIRLTVMVYGTAGYFWVSSCAASRLQLDSIESIKLLLLNVNVVLLEEKSNIKFCNTIFLCSAPNLLTSALRLEMGSTMYSLFKQC